MQTTKIKGYTLSKFLRLGLRNLRSQWRVLFEFKLVFSKMNAKMGKKNGWNLMIINTLSSEI